MSSYLIKNVNILDGTKDMVVKHNFDILVENEKIADIGKNIQFEGKSFDLEGAYIIPGLINLHVHLPASGKISKDKVADKSRLVSFVKSNFIGRAIGKLITSHNAKIELYSGVTSLRSVGGISNFDTEVAKKFNKNLKGPRILSSNEAICTKGGHMEGTVSFPVSSEHEAIQAVERLHSTGSDLIKLMITGGVLDAKEVGYPGVLKMNKEIIKTVCDKAHELGLKVAAHLEGTEGVELAIQNGVDSIEHGAIVNDNLLDKFKKRNGSVVITLSPALPLSNLDPYITGYNEDVQFNSKVVVDKMIALAEKCLEKGIKVGLGTDTGCPYCTHYNMWRELNYYSKSVKGVDPKFALHTATQINAKIMGIDKITGTIEIGKSADMVILKSNPLENLRVLSEPVSVISRGRIFKKKIKKYEDAEQILDNMRI